MYKTIGIAHPHAEAESQAHRGYRGMTGIAENAFINVKNRSYAITVPVELKDVNTNGAIIAQAGAFGGWGAFT